MGRRKKTDIDNEKTKLLKSKHVRLSELVNELETSLEKYGDCPVVGMGCKYGIINGKTNPYCIMLSDIHEIKNTSILLHSIRE